MYVRALYQRNTLSILRRIKAPFSTLAERGHRFEFQSVIRFSAESAYSVDVTVLPNWELDTQEVEALEQASLKCTFVYDLSNPQLLQNELVRRTLQTVQLVTVPNKWLFDEVKRITQAVVVTPSVIDFPYFAQVNSMKSASPPGIACMGGWDWYLVKDAIVAFKESYSHITFYGGPEAVSVLGDLVTPIVVDEQTYPGILRSCLFGLCPSDGYHGLDEVARYEYGAVGRVGCFLPLQQSRVTGDQEITAQYLKEMRSLYLSPAHRAKEQQASFQMAYAHRAKLKAGEYLSTYRKKLPHLFVSR